MRICVDARAPNVGGTRTFTIGFLDQLARHDSRHEFWILIRERDRGLVPDRFRSLVSRVSSPAAEVAWSQLVLPSVLRNHEIDLYHSLKHVGPLWSRSRTVYRVRAIGQFIDTGPQPVPELMYWRYLFGRAVRKADLLIAVSNHLRQFLIRELHIPESRVTSVYNGLDSYFQPLSNGALESCGCGIRERLGTYDRLLLSVGNISPLKNHETAIRAVYQAREAVGCEWHYAIAGEKRNPEYGRLRHLVAELGLEHHVLFLGYVSKEQLRCLYNTADILVHPSLSEGFGFALLEAMACGLPAIVSNWPTNLEITGKSGRVYGDPKDVGALRDVIQDTLSDPKKLGSARKEALTHASQFSWQRCVEETLRAYDRVGAA